MADQLPQSWSPVNPCDHEIETPYYIGELAIAAANCTNACPTTTYADNAQVCHPCPVVGCDTCTPNDCRDCLIFHQSAGGHCLFIYSGIFGAVVLFTLCFCLCGLLRFCCMALLSPRNPGVLKEALAHRRRAKVHDYSLPGNPFYAFDATNVRKNVTGLGIMLYFRFVAFVSTLCFLVAGMLALGYFLPDLVPEDYAPLATIAHAGSLYVMCFIAVLLWICGQDAAMRVDVEEEPHLRNYALVAEGFPKSSRSPHEVKAFFESILGFEIEGVSIAYDHVEEDEFIDDRIARIVEKADCHLGVYPSEFTSVENPASDSQDSYVLDCLMCSGYAFLVFSREEDREFCIRRFAEIDRQVRQGLHRVTPGEEDDDGDSEQEALLKGGKNSRVSKSRIAAGGPSRAVLFRGKFPIRVGAAPEPSGIQWKNFAVRKGAKAIRVAVTLLVSLLLVLVIASVMFAPAVLYEMSFIDLRKHTRLQYQLALSEQGVVSASIAIFNCLLVEALRRATERSGFLQKVNEDSVFAVCAFCTILLNSVAPLIIAAIVSGTQDLQVTRHLSTTYLFQVLWMCIVITEAANTLLPAWSYWSSYFFIRQNGYVSVRESEPLMTTAEFPLAYRYVDMLNILSIVFVMISCESNSLYTIAAQVLVLVYAVYVYFIDKYKFLRANRQTYYLSPTLDSTIHYLFIIPLAILSLFPLQQTLYKKWPWLNYAIFGCNIVLFLIFVRFGQKCNEPQRNLSDVPYVEVASLAPYNYFNTNPVHVLRALHFPSIVVPPIYPYVPGKEYLHGGQFADYDDTVRLRETLMLLVKTPLKGMEATPFGGYIGPG
mmetsp:Transcript_134691/g.234036  ORF Transcript_134691/g.234036 Transcript_134691/m.234036 type:complete len:824 (-) Transcript_134691:88-2559(-)